MKKTTVALAALLAASAAMPAMARGTADSDRAYRDSRGVMYDHDAQIMRSRNFVTLDANNDGWISQAEASTFNDRSFSRADTNKDGILSQSEYRAAVMYHARGDYPVTGNHPNNKDLKPSG